MLSRIETMVLSGSTGQGLPLDAIRGQMASAIDIIIHLGRLRDRTRKVLQIVEILNYEKGEIRTGTLYEFSEASGLLEKTGELTNTEKLRAAGY